MKKLLLLSLLSLTLHAQTIKVGVLAPEGTGWAKLIKKMTEEIKTATAGNVEIKVYYGGSQGDEEDVLRKIRVGQLQGGIFTGKTLGDIYGDMRVMEIPFSFRDPKEGIRVLDKLTPYFNQGLEKKNFKNLVSFHIGNVYFVSQKKASSLNDLKGIKIWSWQGDPVVMSMIDIMKLVSVPLPLPDVLSSLTTGVVEAAYAPAVGIIALQWNTKVKYLVDFPVTLSVGAFVITQDAWKKMSPADQAKVSAITTKFSQDINNNNLKETEDSLKAMKAQKIEFLKFPDSEVKVATGYRKDIIAHLKGKLFSAEALAKFEAELKK